MHADIQSVSPTRSVLVLSIPADESAASRAAVVKEYAAQATIPGFRPGKAPAALVERRFADRIGPAARDRAVRDAFRQAVDENGLKVLEIVDSKEPETADDGSLSVTVTVDLVPSFDLPPLDGIPVDAKDTTVDDAQVDERLASLRRSLADFADLAADAELKTDDLATVDYSAAAEDGRPLEEAMPDAGPFAKREKAVIAVGSDHSLVPGLAAALVGRKIGESGSFEAAFPDDFYQTSLRGVKATWNWTVVSARTLVLPPDEEFCKRLGVADEAELRTRLRSSMEQRAAAADETRRINQIAHWLSHAVSFDPPQAALDRLSDRILSDLLRANMDKGVAKEDLSKERDRLVAAAREQAAERLRADFVLDAVAAERKIGVSQEELTAYLDGVVRRERLSEEQVKALARDRDAIRGYRDQAVREKVLAELLKTAARTPDFQG